MAPLAFYAQFPFRCFTYDGGRDPRELALPQPFTGLLTTLRGLPMCCVSGVARQDQFGGLSDVTIPSQDNDALLPPELPRRLYTFLSRVMPLRRYIL
jgi:hypothetical protein